MSKDLFLMMREQEIATSNFLPTKKELQISSRQFANSLVDSGDFELQELYSQALRLKEALATIESTLKTHLPDEDFEAYGMKANYRSGGEILNYKEDDVWSRLKSDMKEREDLLKLAYKSDKAMYDEDGVQVPKVTSTQRKSSLAITY